MTRVDGTKGVTWLDPSTLRSLPYSGDCKGASLRGDLIYYYLRLSFRLARTYRSGVRVVVPFPDSGLVVSPH